MAISKNSGKLLHVYSEDQSLVIVVANNEVMQNFALLDLEPKMHDHTLSKRPTHGAKQTLIQRTT